MTPKGAKGAPKVSPKSTKIPQKIATSKKVEFRVVQVLSFVDIFDFFWSKMRQKIDAKNDAEKHVKKLEN